MGASIRSRIRLIAAVLSLAGLSACASSPEAREANDPFEPANRAVYGFNQAVDAAVLEPASEAYVAITPQPARDGVRNFMNNLNEPVVFVNTLLQGDLEGAGVTAARFGMNTVFGLGGLVDVASREGLQRRDEDFGQTLGAWGAEPGPYLMLPFFGPSNVRDGIGRFADRYPHPLNWNEDYSDSDWAWTLRAVNGIDFRARSAGVMQRIDETAIDPYVQIRSAYQQMRRDRIANGEDVEDLPDFD